MSVSLLKIELSPMGNKANNTNVNLVWGGAGRCCPTQCHCPRNHLTLTRGAENPDKPRVTGGHHALTVPALHSVPCGLSLQATYALRHLTTGHVCPATSGHACPVISHCGPRVPCGLSAQATSDLSPVITSARVSHSLCPPH
ncbi:hypothetical protein Pcinc_032030 [Petrolisthes cinctipes]|uniref:Uncharacterized protein n=1 Tax=Petrolisthes cinctipes TaxID=88211 RepID=A0AAE1EVE1_PETCI|nr:hypothetical protein Pcinc_032030 [Petrolisthes cinctipes]